MMESALNTTETTQDCYGSESIRIAKINATLGGKRLSASPIARCIAPMLVALDWFGAPRTLLTTLPEESVVIDTEDVGRLLAEQGFTTHTLSWRRCAGGVDVLAVGSMVLSEPQVHVYLGQLDGVDWWHDGEKLSSDFIASASDLVLLVNRRADHQPLDAAQVGWLKKLFFDARKEIGGILLVSLVANLLALLISLFSMFVYNSVIPSGAISSLWSMSLGVVIAVLGAWWLRNARARLLVNLTGWAGSRISDIAFRKTFGLPVEVSARAGVENNLIRLRSIEGVRQWFGGGGGAVSADYPFVVIFLVVISLLGGWIVLVPLCSLLLFAALAVPFAHFVEARSNRVGRVSRIVGEFTSVLTRRLRGIRGVRGSALWRKRLLDLVADSVEANRDYALATGMTQSISQALGMLTVLATMGFGILLVLNQTMSTGGLIATMMLIWRVTTPAQQMFANQVRVRQLVDSTRQFERLLLSVGESQQPQMTSPVAELSASITADRIYYRYSADQEPALSGISFEVKPGQLVAVVGPNGAGKSTLMSILAGVRQSQNGRLLIGGRNIRQFDPSDYREWVGYFPQSVHIVPFSSREVLSLRRPVTTEEEMYTALSMVAGDNWWQLLGCSSRAQALDNVIPPWGEERDVVRARFIVRLAATIVGTPPLILLDDPLSDGDPALDVHFLHLLETLRGRSTIILATHRPDLIQRADQIAVLNEGGLVHFGPVVQP
jgi:ATP-binding cassette subfamily C protein LapB